MLIISEKYSLIYSNSIIQGNQLYKATIKVYNTLISKDMKQKKKKQNLINKWKQMPKRNVDLSVLKSRKQMKIQNKDHVFYNFLQHVIDFSLSVYIYYLIYII